MILSQRLCGSTALLGVLLPLAIASAQAAEEVLVTDTALSPDTMVAPDTTLVSGDAFAGRRLYTSDPAKMLDKVPGMTTAAGGGISGFPTLNGMADDRINILIDGNPSIQACPNHMNPPLSYVDPSTVEAIEVLRGVSPVSMGGDSIAGTISVTTKSPVFAKPGEGYHVEGEMSAFYRSNGHAIGGAASATGATESVSATYQGSASRSRNYQDGNGDSVLSSKYSARSHSLSLAGQTAKGDLLEVQGGQQVIPYQAYPNQWMDMTYNRQDFLNGHYLGRFDFGTVDARAYWQYVTHVMDIIAPDKMGAMPMDTDAYNMGYSVKAEFKGGNGNLFRIGNELAHQTLDDWWPPVDPATDPMMMMSPDTFVNINQGRRDRVGTFAEWEAQWTSQWSTLLGLRNDVVWMDAGDVQGYSMMYAADAAAFNAREHARTDVNIDATALARFTPDASADYAFGYARKTRSPNFYERYAWSTSNMGSSMVNWTGDLNGYVGNLDLDPEVAHNISFSAAWHDAARQDWSVSFTPYASYVQDYIDVDPIGILPYGGGAKLQFANHDAILFGFDLTGRKAVVTGASWGDLAVTGSLALTRGERTDGGSLYHMMPLHGTIGLEHHLDQWTSAAETEIVTHKRYTDENRNEPETAGYALVNLRTSYQVLPNARVDFAVENVLDQQFSDPLGGLDVSTGRSVAGMGRSFNLGMTVKF